MWKCYSKKHVVIHTYHKDWAYYRKYCKLKRLDNYKKSLKILKDANVPYIEDSYKNIKITINNVNITFCPTTGVFYGTHNGRGVFQLIKEIL